MEYIEELDKEFQLLGFNNYKDLFKESYSADRNDDKDTDVLSFFELLDYSESKDKDIYYHHTVARSRETGKWYVKEIIGSCQIPSDRYDIGVTVISSKHEPPVHRNEIDNKLTEIIAKEMIEERRYQLPLQEIRQGRTVMTKTRSR